MPGFGRCPSPWPGERRWHVLLAEPVRLVMTSGSGAAPSLRVGMLSTWRSPGRVASAWFAAGGDEAGFVGDDDELGPVSGVEFHHGPVYMCLGGGWTDDQAFSDVVVGQARGDQG